MTPMPPWSVSAPSWPPLRQGSDQGSQRRQSVTGSVTWQSGGGRGPRGPAAAEGPRVAGERARLEDSPLAVGGHAVMVPANCQLEPGQARQPHLRAQPQQRSRRDGLYAPEIQRVADEQVSRITPSAPQPDAAGDRSSSPRTAHAAGKEYHPGAGAAGAGHLAAV